MEQQRDFSNKAAQNTIFGELTVGERTDQVNIEFQYAISALDTIQTLSGTGALSFSQGKAGIGCGAAVGSARLESRGSVRYIPGHECVAHFTSAYTAPEANSRQKHGIFDAMNGAFFGYQNGVFGISILRGGVETFIAQTDWNADKANGTGNSGFTLNPQKYNIYQISYGWLGAAPIVFAVYAGQGRGWIMLHSHDITNTGTGPHILNPTLPIAAESSRTSGTGANLEVSTSSWRAGIVGITPFGSLIDRNFATIVEQKSLSGGTLTPILSLKNKTTFRGLSNHVRARYATISLASDGTKPVSFQVLKGATLTGAAFADQDANESVMQVDTTASAVSGGTLSGGNVLQKLDSMRINFLSNDAVIAIYPGETVTLCAKSANASVVDVFLRWTEEF